MMNQIFGLSSAEILVRAFKGGRGEKVIEKCVYKEEFVCVCVCARFIV